MTALRVEEIGDAGSLSPLRDEWRALVAMAPGSEIFQTWEWVHAWLGSFWAGRPLAFLFVRDGGRLVGIVPLVHDEEGILGCRDSLTLPVNPHVRRMDAICAAPPAEVAAAALDHLVRTRSHVRIALRDCRADAPGSAALATAAADRGLGSLRIASFPSPIVRIASTFDAYLASRPPRVRHELKRKVRNGEAHSGFSLAVLGSPEERDRAIAAILEIERRSWKEEAGTSFTAEASLTPFYTDVATSFAHAGWLRVFLLYAGATPVAHLFGASYGGQYFAIKTSYDEAFRAASPGAVLFYHALKDAFERGMATFDFLGNPARWKDELASEERQHVRYCAYSRLDPVCHWCNIRELHVRPLARRVRDAATSTAARHGSESP